MNPIRLAAWAEMALALERPFATALRSASHLQTIYLKLEDAQGFAGYGEAVPVPKVTGEDRQQILTDIQVLLAFARGRTAPVLLQAARDGWPVTGRTARAAFACALSDLVAKQNRQPLYRLLGGKLRDLHTAHTLSVDEPVAMAEVAGRVLQQGFRTLKLKLAGPWEKDRERIDAVQDVCRGEAIFWLDANQAWQPGEAVTCLSQLAKLGFPIELVEQPVPAADLQGLRHVKQHSPFPIVADESVFSLRDLRRVLALDAAHVINVKLAKCGGLVEAMALATLAATAGKPCMLGCMLESGVAASAAAHLALTREMFHYIDLDGPLFCRQSPVQGGISYTGSRIVVGDGDGTGVSGISGAQWVDG